MKKKFLCTSETFILTYNTYIPLYFWCRAKAFSMNMKLLLGVSLLLFVYNKPIMYHLLFDSLWLAHLFQRNLFFVFHEYFIVINNKIKNLIWFATHIVLPVGTSHTCWRLHRVILSGVFLKHRFPSTHHTDSPDTLPKHLCLCVYTCQQTTKL